MDPITKALALSPKSGPTIKEEDYDQHIKPQLTLVNKATYIATICRHLDKHPEDPCDNGEIELLRNMLRLYLSTKIPLLGHPVTKKVVIKPDESAAMNMFHEIDPHLKRIRNFRQINPLFSEELSRILLVDERLISRNRTSNVNETTFETLCTIFKQSSAYHHENEAAVQGSSYSPFFFSLFNSMTDWLIPQCQTTNMRYCMNSIQSGNSINEIRNEGINEGIAVVEYLIGRHLLDEEDMVTISNKPHGNSIPDFGIQLSKLTTKDGIIKITNKKLISMAEIKFTGLEEFILSFLTGDEFALDINDSNKRRKFSLLLREVIVYAASHTIFSDFLCLCDNEYQLLIIFDDMNIRNWSDQSESDQLKWIPLRYLVFNGGICTILDEQGNRVKLTLQAVLSTLCNISLKRVEDLRRFDERQIEMSNLPDRLLQFRYNELIFQLKLHAYLVKHESIATSRPPTAGTAQSAGTMYSGSKSSEDESFDRQQRPLSNTTQGSNEENVNEEANSDQAPWPTAFNKIQNYHDLFETGLPFSFRPIQFGWKYCCQVMLFRMERFKVYFPQLLAHRPSLINYDKIIMKIYDYGSIETFFKENKELKASFKDVNDFLSRFVDVNYQMEIKALTKIQLHNSRADTESQINAPKLIGYGELGFGTFIPSGSFNLCGKYQLLEYLEPDAGTNCEGSEDQPGHVKLNEDLYNDGLRQLEQMKKLNIVHSDLKKRKEYDY